MTKIYANVARVLLGLVLVIAVLFRLFASPPIALNIFLYHVFLAPAGLPIGFGLLAIHVALLVAYADAYRFLVRLKVSVAE